MNEIELKALEQISGGLIELEGQVDSEKEVMRIIEERVAEMLYRNPDLLMSYMYRLDVEEYKIKMVLKGMAKESIPQLLAHLIWKRQKLRAKTKINYSGGKKGNWSFDVE